MLRRWLDRRRAARRRQAAADLQVWLDSSRALLDLCREPLQMLDGPSDIGVLLDRIDRRLMRYRNEAAAARGALRRDAEMGADVRQATDDLFVLRNETFAFLLRWRSLQLLPASHPASVEAQRSADEARLQASRTARAVGDHLERVGPEVEALATAWSLPATAPD